MRLDQWKIWERKLSLSKRIISLITINRWFSHIFSIVRSSWINLSFHLEETLNDCFKTVWILCKRDSGLFVYPGIRSLYIPLRAHGKRKLCIEKWILDISVLSSVIFMRLNPRRVYSIGLWLLCATDLISWSEENDTHFLGLNKSQLGLKYAQNYSLLLIIWR